MGLNLQRYLKMHIDNDVNIFFKQLESSGADKIAPWLFKILGDFKDFMLT